MGYDMTTVTKDPDEDQRVAELRKRMYAARKENRVGEADQLYMEVKAAERSYFRLNVWAMGMARELMHKIGMLDLDRPAETTEFPDPASFGVTSEMWNDWDGEVDENTPEQLRNYNAAVEALVSFQRETPAGIPLHKLRTNDDWLVTPAEIASALAALGDTAVPDAPSWWGQWIDWLRYAQEHDGFRVN